MTAEVKDRRRKRQNTDDGEYEITDEYGCRRVFYAPTDKLVNIDPDGVKKTLDARVDELHIHPRVPTYVQADDTLVAVEHAGPGDMRVCLTDEWPYSDLPIIGVRILPDG